MSFFPNERTFIKILGISIEWYAICILIGATIAYLLAQRNFKKLGYSKDILADFFVNVLLVGIIGSRIWYVVFMFKEYYIDHLSEIIMIQNGGLAIQGGVLAGIIYGYYYMKKKNIPFFVAADAIIPGVLIAQAIGRWGNLINKEAFGTVVERSFLESLFIPGFIIDRMNISGVYHHPTFLYESVLNIIGFFLIVFVVKKWKQHDGTLFFSYFIWYGIVRFFVEGMRTDSLMLESFRMAQLTSVAFLVVGIGGIIYLYRKQTTKITQ